MKTLSRMELPSTWNTQTPEYCFQTKNPRSAFLHFDAEESYADSLTLLNKIVKQQSWLKPTTNINQNISPILIG